MRLRRISHRFLLLYFLCSVPVALLGVAFIGYKVGNKLSARFQQKQIERKTQAGLRHLPLDAGKIGSLGAVAKFDWSAAPSVQQAQSALRSSFASALGEKLEYLADPKLTALHREELPCGVTRVKAIVPAEEGFQLKVCLLLPSGKALAPAVVMAYGLGGSILAVSGYDIESYHNDMGLGLAQAGYIAVSYELRGLGPYAQDWGDPDWGRMVYADFVGYTLIRRSCAMNVWVYDGLQVLEAVNNHPRAAPARTAFVGISHGGQVAMYAAGLAPDRIQAAIAMGSFLSFEDLYTRIHNMTGHAIPSIAQLADMGDLAALVAPRPLLVQWGALERDTRHGPLRENSLREFERAQKIYGRFDAEDMMVSHISSDVGHGFDVDAAIEFLNKHL